jgi:multiple sugar transport system ATP-binding protein
MASISLREVTKVFSRRVVGVAGLSLDVNDGELMVIVGPSGCGKTTILRLIAGLEQPTSGTIRIGDRVADEVLPRERNVAMVFQDGSLYPHMSIYDNLAFPLRMRRQSEARVRQRVSAVIEMLGLADLAERKPAALSGGQRQRVALGRAIVREPAVFLFDEPLSSLDAGLRRALRAEIKTLHQRLHTTTLYVTHDQSEAMALGERVGVLRDGRLQQVGRPREVYDQPANRFVAGFFGTPPMNFLAARVCRDGTTIALEVEANTLGLPPLLRSRLADYTNDTVVLGIRPHDMSLEPAPGQPESTLCGRVVLVEHFGSRVDVHVALSARETCVVSTSPSAPACIDDDIRVHIDVTKLHLFEPDDLGRSIV